MELVLPVWITLSLLHGLTCSENERLDFLENEVESFYDRFDLLENKISMDKTYLKMKQDRQFLSLRTEVESSLRQHVAETLSEILRGETIENIIRSQVISETKQLKRENHRMKRQLTHMQRTLGRVQNDNSVYRDALMKGQGEKRELITCKNCMESELLESKMRKLDHEVNELHRTLREQSYLLKSSLKGTALPGEASTTISSVTTTSPTRQTTTETPGEMGRLLIAPLWQSAKHQFRYLRINSNSVHVYSYLNLKEVLSVVYISKLSSLLIGLRDPDKIISSKLNSTRIRTVRHSLRTYGMEADEERGVIFLTTTKPDKTISTMTMQGRRFTTLVNLTDYGDWPRAIALQRDIKMVYACNYGKLFSVRYDGSGLTTLDTGTHMYAVTLDITNGLLYYNREQRLMKMSLSTNTSCEVTKLSFEIWNLIYYKNRVYYISCCRSPATLGEVDVGHDMASYSLQSVEVNDVENFAICLIP